MIYPSKTADNNKALSPSYVSTERLDNFVHVLQHASKCKSTSCRGSCMRMKLVMEHFVTCQQCEVCRKFFSAVFYHSSHCGKKDCKTLYCNQTKQKINQVLSH
ncbi:unnamed protein product [Bursaphelenchus okinawaensis]|uniref:histone acetyltransferase n=1 Tax=Bursaphelenchus okinawaensis TaxID=465554 RepID=A0A811L8I0_9BILA|nr:unnamed protein product [Bursaphelenchus okinawaensis]CAG9117909.1 unnamed protein product [Bursaphelenchus okinawaensis]